MNSHGQTFNIHIAA